MAIALLSIVQTLLFLASFKATKTYFGSTKKVATIGAWLLRGKKTQLQRNPILKSFDKQVQKDKRNSATMILAPSIFIKSAGMILLGLVGLSFLIIPVQGVFMAALFIETVKTGQYDNLLKRAMGWQFATQLFFAVVGNLLGLSFFLGLHLPDIRTFTDNWWFWCLLLVPITTAYITAKLETTYYHQNRTKILS